MPVGEIVPLPTMHFPRTARKTDVGTPAQRQILYSHEDIPYIGFTEIDSPPYSS